MVQAGEKILDLPTPDVRIEQAEGRDTAEGSVGSTEPNAGRLESSKRGRSNVSDVGKAIKSIGLDWGKEALMLSACESPRRNSDDSANITDLPPEGASQDLEGGVGQTVTNGFNKVRAFGDDAEDFTAAKKVRDVSRKGCHVAVILPPNGSAGNVRLTSWH